MTVPVFPMRKLMAFCVLMTLCVSAHGFQSKMYYVNNGNLYSYYGVRYNDAGLVVKDVVVRNGVLFWIESAGDASWLVMWTHYRKYYQSLDITAPVSIEMNDYYVHVANDSTAGDIYRIQWTSDPHKGLTRYGAVAFDITNDYVVWFERDGCTVALSKGKAVSRRWCIFQTVKPSRYKEIGFTTYRQTPNTSVGCLSMAVKRTQSSQTHRLEGMRLI